MNTYLHNDLGFEWTSCEQKTVRRITGTGVPALSDVYAMTWKLAASS
jgi:hypothetical protein